MVRVTFGATGNPSLYVCSGGALGEMKRYVVPWMRGGEIRLSVCRSYDALMKQLGNLELRSDVSFPADSKTVRDFVKRDLLGRKFPIRWIRPLKTKAQTARDKVAKKEAFVKHAPTILIVPKMRKKMMEDIKKAKKKADAKIITEKAARMKKAVVRARAAEKERTVKAAVAARYRVPTPDIPGLDMLGDNKMLIAVAAIGGIGAAVAVGAYAYSKRKR